MYSEYRVRTFAWAVFRGIHYETWQHDTQYSVHIIMYYLLHVNCPKHDALSLEPTRIPVKMHISGTDSLSGRTIFVHGCSYSLRDLQIHGLWLGKFPGGSENMYELKGFLKLGTYFLHFINCLFTESSFLTKLIDCVNHLSTATIKATSSCQCKLLK
jgi:hypothetical protein